MTRTAVVKVELLAIAFVIAIAITPLVYADGATRDRITTVEYELTDAYPGGIEHAKLARDMELVGWKTGRNAYFGRTKVAGKYAVGFVFKSNKIVYGITNRGIRVTRFF